MIAKDPICEHMRLYLKRRGRAHLGGGGFSHQSTEVKWNLVRNFITRARNREQMTVLVLHVWGPGFSPNDLKMATKITPLIHRRSFITDIKDYFVLRWTLHPALLCSILQTPCLAVPTTIKEGVKWRPHLFKNQLIFLSLTIKLHVLIMASTISWNTYTW